MDDAAALVSKDEQNEERAECRGRYDEEIHRRQKHGSPGTHATKNVARLGGVDESVCILLDQEPL